MYLQEVPGGAEPLLQGYVRTEWPSGSEIQSGRVTQWVRLFSASAALWSQIRAVSVALRIEHKPGHALSTLHSFTVPKSQEDRLRLIIAAFLRTDRIAAGEACAPETAGEIAGGFVHLEEKRFGLVPENFEASGGLRIHPNIRLAEHLPALFQAAMDLGLHLAYEMQAAPWTPPRELLRGVLYDAAHLADSPAVPRSVATDQTALAERMKRAQYHLAECVSAPAEGQAGAVAETVSNILERTIYAQFGAAPQLAVLAETEAKAFALHRHVHTMPGSPALDDASAAATGEDLDRILGCYMLGISKPDGNLIHRRFFAPPGSPSGPAGSSPSGPGAPPGSFLFVSYARADSQDVYPLVDHLQQDGIGLWIDRRLLAGDDWLDELEVQLNRCAGILAFVTPSFVSSRYCGREVRYGDALQRKILPVVLKPFESAGGLSLILHSLQQVRISEPADYARLLTSIRYHVPPASH